MLNLSAGAITQKNKLGADSVWVVLLEIQIPTTPTTTLYLTNNNEEITWNGQAWQPFPFDLEPVRENSQNELPVAVIRVSNVTRDVLAYLEQAGGAVDFPVILRVVNTEVLGGSSPELEFEYTVRRIQYDTNWITFTLGGTQHVARRTPERRWQKDFCPFVYGGVECGVPAATVAAFPTCNKSLASCRERSNSTRYGGEPGIPTGGFYASV